MTEFGLVVEPVPGHTADFAVRCEAMGFDALLCPDTQNLAGDPYGQLALAAASTSTIRLGTGVTNPVTRVPAATAGAVASLHVESAGRAICGIGRGDSSAAYAGRRSATLAELRNYVRDVRAYLRGADVTQGERTAPLKWFDADAFEAAPVDVAATGPKTIELAADVADRASFAVGSAPERIRWARDVLRRRCEQTGRTVAVGAYVNIVVDRDAHRARELARVGAALFAHFTGMKGAGLDHLPPQLRPIAERMQTGYDMEHHARDEASHLTSVDDEFVDWYTIAAAPSEAVDRLGELIDLGLEHVYVIGGSAVAAPPAARQGALVDAQELLAAEVLPAFR